MKGRGWGVVRWMVEYDEGEKREWGWMDDGVGSGREEESGPDGWSSGIGEN